MGWFTYIKYALIYLHWVSVEVLYISSLVGIETVVETLGKKASIAKSTNRAHSLMSNKRTNLTDSVTHPVGPVGAFTCLEIPAPVLHQRALCSQLLSNMSYGRASWFVFTSLANRSALRIVSRVFLYNYVNITKACKAVQKKVKIVLRMKL